MRRLGLATLLCFGLSLVAASAYGDTAVYTGDSDAVQFPATMANGAAITYQADTITFDTLPDYAGDVVVMPHAANMGRGDFVYTIDLAMTDQDGVGGYYGMGIKVNFGPEAEGVDNDVLIAWNNYSDGPGKYLSIWAFGTETYNGPPDADAAGAGALSLRLALTGGSLVVSFKPVGGEWTEHATHDIDATAFAGMDWSLAVENWGQDLATGGILSFMVGEISVTYAPLARYTGDGDAVQFPATMDNGAAITYQADTITFETLPDYAGDVVVMPHAANMGRGDFVYTIDLAMTDQDGVGGYYGMGIKVNFGPEAEGVDNDVLIAWNNYSDGPGKYLSIWAFGTETYNGPPDADAAGAGALSLRLALTGGSLVVSFKPVGGAWTEHATHDIDATAFAGMDWSLAVENWGQDLATGGILTFMVDEISVTYSSLAKFTGDSDAVKLPATMDNGAAITYQTDTITFETLPDYAGDAVTPPGFDTGRGDFVYTIDLAMTDQDGVGGYYGMGIKVNFGPEAEGVDNDVLIAWNNYSDGPGKYLSIWAFGTETYNGPPDADAAGAGALSLRLALTGGSLVVSFKPVGGAWTEHATHDIDATAFAGMDWSLAVENWGQDLATGGILSFMVDEISVLLPSVSETPVISLVGNDTVAVTLGGSYTDAGATAGDAQDGDITADIVVGGDTVDPDTLGTYTITYNVTDSDGNAADEVTRTVIVQDLTPVISLVGTPTVVVDLDGVYTEDGATALDDVDGDITSDIVVGGDIVDTSMAGTYTVTYNVSDSGGNDAVEATRTVIVEDPKAEEADSVCGSCDGFVLWSPSNTDNWNNLGVGAGELPPGVDYMVQLDLMGDPLTSIIGGTGSGFYFGGGPDDHPSITYTTNPATGEVLLSGAPGVDPIDVGEGPISLRVSRTGLTRTLEYTTPGSHPALPGSWITMYTQELDPDGIGSLYMNMWFGGGTPDPGFRFDRITSTVDGVTTVWDGPDSPFEQTVVWSDIGVVDLFSCPPDGFVLWSPSNTDNWNNLGVGAGELPPGVDYMVQLDLMGDPLTSIIGGTGSGFYFGGGPDDHPSITYTTNPATGEVLLSGAPGVDPIDVGEGPISLRVSRTGLTRTLEYTTPGSHPALPGSWITMYTQELDPDGIGSLYMNMWFGGGTPDPGFRFDRITSTVDGVTTVWDGPDSPFEQTVVWSDIGVVDLFSCPPDGFVLWSPSNTDNWNNLGVGAGELPPGVDYMVQLDLMGDPLTSIIGGTGSGFYFGGGPDDHPSITYTTNPATGEVLLSGAPGVDPIDVGEGPISLRVSRTGLTRTLEYTTPGSHPALPGSWTTMYTQELDPDGTGSLYMNMWFGGGTPDPGFRFDRITSTVDGVTTIWDGPDSPFEQVVVWSDIGVVADICPTLDEAGPEPVIRLVGGPTLRCEEGPSCDALVPFTAPAAVARDPEDGDISADLVVAGVEAAAEAIANTTFGTYIITYNITDSDGNAAEEATLAVTVGTETVPPTISLFGDAEMTVGYLHTYEEPGALALDNRDDSDELTAAIVYGGTVDTSAVGTYILTYNVSDARGNAAVEAIRTVTVADLEGPVVTPTGGPYIEVDQGGIYTEAGATAEDNLDGDVTADIVIGGASVDTATVSTYAVTYTVSDAAGNETVGTRTVAVVDITPPVITLTVAETISISQWSDFDYTDVAATAADGIDGDITGNIVVTGSVNTNVAGDYILTYTITDAAGNEAVVTRTVTVGPDVTPPVITLLWPEDYVEGSNTVVVPQGGLYIDEGASAFDDVDGDVTKEDETTGVIGIVIDASGVDMSTLGEYVVTLTATDLVGNEAVVTRTVIVEPDTEPPLITVTPDELATQEINPTLAVGDLYRDKGSTAFDNADLDVSGSIVAISWRVGDETVVFSNDDAVDTATPGTYIITYNVTDSVGNVAEEQMRTVTVVDAQISGTVEDTSGNPLADAVVEVYLPVGNEYNILDPENEGDVLVESTDDFFAWRYETLTAADGTYAFVLPSDAPLAGWTVVASMAGYASQVSANKDPDVDTLANFAGGSALAPRTEIVSVTATVGASKTGLEITGDPAFTDAGQVTVEVESGDGDVDNDSNSLSDDGSIQATYEGVDDFTVRITTDTSELLFPYVAEDADLLVKLGEIGAGGGTVDMATEAGQPVKVEVPTGGVAGFPAFTIEIKQIPIEETTEANEGSLGYVYEITVLSPQTILDDDDIIIADVGEAMPNANIKRLLITLPIDLSVVNQNDMEDGIYVIYRADSRLSLDQPGEATPVPVGQILDTDYTGDGLVGSVTFWTDALSVFGIGRVRTELAVQSEQDTLPPSCFVNMIAHGQSSEWDTGSLLPFGLIAGLMLIAGILSHLRGRSRKAVAGLAVFVACAFLMAGPADARDGGFYVELNGMYAFEDIDLGETEGKFTAPLPVDLDFKDSSGFQFAVGRALGDSLSVKVMFEYVQSFETLKDLDFQTWDKLDVLHLSVNAKLSYPAWQRVRPYLIAGFGGISAHERILYLRSETSTTRNLGISLRGGAGVDVFITDSVSIGLEGAYTSGIGDVDHVKYKTVSVGIGYHF